MSTLHTLWKTQQELNTSYSVIAHNGELLCSTERMDLPVFKAELQEDDDAAKKKGVYCIEEEAAGFISASDIKDRILDCEAKIRLYFDMEAEEDVWAKFFELAPFDQVDLLENEDEEDAGQHISDQNGK